MTAIGRFIQVNSTAVIITLQLGDYLITPL